ncbi:MAG: RidA family protein [Planctomycetes bacterium]|nr:RidA family protein [Planctomycetota bacterium]
MPQKQPFYPEKAFVGGPYSPAISVGDQVFVAGQGPISPSTQQIAGDTFEDQLELTFSNVDAVLRAAGCTLDDCVKVNVYLSTMSNFDALNTIYRQKFTAPFPVRTTVQAELWGQIQVEIDVIAVRGCGARK